MSKRPAKAGPTRKPAAPQGKAPAAKSKTGSAPTVKKATSMAGTPKPKSNATKLTKAAEATAKASSKSLLQEASTKISTLAADILADRIIPTIEQIKEIAESVLHKGKHAKAKKRKK